MSDCAFIVLETPESVALANRLNSVGVKVILYSQFKPSSTMLKEADELRLKYAAMDRLRAKGDLSDKKLDSEMTKVKQEELEVEMELKDRRLHHQDEYDIQDGDLSDCSELSEDPENYTERKLKQKLRYLEQKRRVEHEKRTEDHRRRIRLAKKNLKGVGMTSYMNPIRFIEEQTEFNGKALYSTEGSKSKFSKIPSTERKEQVEKFLSTIRSTTESLAATMRFFRNSEVFEIKDKRIKEGKYKLKRVKWKFADTEKTLYRRFPFRVISSIDQLPIATERARITSVYLAIPYSSTILIKEYRELFEDVLQAIGKECKYISLQHSDRIWSYLSDNIPEDFRSLGAYPTVSLLLSKRTIRASIPKSSKPKQKKTRRVVEYKGCCWDMQTQEVNIPVKDDEANEEIPQATVDSEENQLARTPKANGNRKVDSRKHISDTTKALSPHNDPSAQVPIQHLGARAQTAQTVPRKEREEIEKSKSKDKRLLNNQPRSWFPFVQKLDASDSIISLRMRVQSKKVKQLISASAADIAHLQRKQAMRAYFRYNKDFRRNGVFGSIGNPLNRNKRFVDDEVDYYDLDSKTRESSFSGHKRYYAFFELSKTPKFLSIYLGSLKQEFLYILPEHSLKSRWRLMAALLIPTVVALKSNNWKKLRSEKELLTVAGGAICEILSLGGIINRILAIVFWLLFDGGRLIVLLVQWSLYFYLGDLLEPYLKQRFKYGGFGEEDLCLYLDDFYRQGRQVGIELSAVKALENREAQLLKDVPSKDIPLYYKYTTEYWD